MTDPRRDAAAPGPYVIAEAGVNHDGDPDVAHQLVELAARCGAGAVKFQTFEVDQLVAAVAVTAPYQARAGAVATQSEMLAALTLPRSAWRELADHSRSLGLDFLSTPFDLRSADLLVELGVGAIKLGSGEVTNTPFLRRVADLGIPVLASTGMSTLVEVDAAVEALSAAPGTTLLHCVSAYPAPSAEANLSVIPVLAARYGVPVGWSDHTLDHLSAVAATALGATVLERHITLDRARPGPDHAASSDEGQFSAYVDLVRATAAALGDGVKRPSPSERENMTAARRSWHVVRDLPAGHRLSGGDLVALRPATGVSPAVDLVGVRTARTLHAGASVRPEDLLGDQDVARGADGREALT